MNSTSETDATNVIIEAIFKVTAKDTISKYYIKEAIQQILYHLMTIGYMENAVDYRNFFRPNGVRCLDEQSVNEY